MCKGSDARSRGTGSKCAFGGTGGGGGGQQGGVGGAALGFCCSKPSPTATLPYTTLVFLFVLDTARRAAGTAAREAFLESVFLATATREFSAFFF